MKIFYIILLVLSPATYAMDQRYKTILKHSSKALLSYPQAKSARRYLEKKAIQYSPLDKKTLAVVGSVVMSARDQKLSTKRIKNMKLKVLGGRLRPDIEYNWLNRSTFGGFHFELRF